jgi:hypothetical protein
LSDGGVGRARAVAGVCYGRAVMKVMRLLLRWYWSYRVEKSHVRRPRLASQGVPRMMSTSLPMSRR